MANSDPTKLKLAKNVSVKGIYFSAARIPGSARLVCGASDFNVYEIDLDAEKPEPILFEGTGHESYVTATALVGDQVVTGSYDQRLIWWNVADKKPVRTVEAHDRWIRMLAVTPDGKTLASVADDMTVKLWNAKTGELLQTLTDHAPMTPHHYPSMLYAVTFSRDGKLLATGDKTGITIIRETATGKKLAEIETPIMYTWDPRQRRHSIGGIRSLAFSHDSNLLSVGGIGTIGNIDHLGGPSRIEVFDWKKGERLHEISDDKFKGLIEEMAFDPDGKWLLAAGGDHNGFVSFYDVASGKVLQQEKAPMHVHAFELNDDLDTLYAVGHDKVASFEFRATAEKKKPELASEEKQAAG